MSFESALKTLRRRVSALVELSWRCGVRVVGWLRPSRARAWSSTGRERVTVLAPHPDDEARACAGAILRHIRSGDDVVVVIATDGRLAGAAALPDDVAALRRNEAKEAARRLGINRLEWLGLREGAWRIDDLEKQLREVLVRSLPTIVYAPDRKSTRLN